MRYLGGKYRIRKELGEVLNEKLKENQTFVDLMCGSCWITCEIDKNREIIANDKHKYLISMWKALQDGWEPPTNISKEDYYYIKNNLDEYPELSGLVGFGCSFGGRWFEGFARCKTSERSYYKEAKKAVKKKIESMGNIVFTNFDYRDLDIPVGSLVYCDIPYRGKKGYSKKEVGEFDYEGFYDWVQENKYKYDIYISEYLENVPSGYEVVWRKTAKTDLNNTVGKKVKTTEVLMTPSKSNS